MTPLDTDNSATECKARIYNQNGKRKKHKQRRCRIDKMVRNKEKKDKIVNAHPIVSMLSEIEIMGEKHSLAIGGFSTDGFYLKNPYELVKEETKGLCGDNLTYYSFVKSSKKMSEYEKVIRKGKARDKKWEEDRKKELQKELDELNKKTKTNKGDL